MKLFEKKTAILAAAVLLAVSGVAGAADQGQNSGGAEVLAPADGIQHDGDSNWGVTSDSTVTYVAHKFEPIDSGVTYNFATTGNNLSITRSNATGSVWMEAPINMPNGAQIRAIEFRFCDSSTTLGFFTFITINNKNGSVVQTPLVSSTQAENIGCVNRTFTFATPLVVDNNNIAYSLEANLGGTGTAGSTAIVLSQARVYYRLQVSPAPATATFADVPVGHSQHRFVEALVAAGITGGCGGGNYCPNDAVTRGQMAVFLAAALGMHFPN